MLQEHTNQNAEQLAQLIRVACERVDSLSHLQSVDLHQRERLSEAFEDLFILLEELRLAEKELRVKNEELMSMREIMDIEQERYKELFEHAPDAYVLTGPDARIQQSNNAAADLFQINKTKLTGLTLMLFIDESDHHKLRESLASLENQDIVKGIEIRIQPSTGPLTYGLLTIGAVHDVDGCIRGIHWFVRDITKQKEAEEALKLSEERFRSIAESARDAIIVTDDNGNILSWNKGAEQMFLYDEKEITGKHFNTLIPDRFKPDLLVDQTPINGKTAEMFGVRKELSEFPIEISHSTWHANGKDYNTVIIRDITERRQAEEMRVRLLERILAGQEEDRRWIARELHDETGQSLSSLLVGLRMIEEARTLKKAKIEASRLRAITAQTLDDVGRLVKGLRPIILDDLGLMVALKRHASDFARAFNITIDFKVRGLESKRLPLAAETGLFRIAQEALTNIAKHSGARNIHFYIEKDENEIELSIQDDGRGFDVEKALAASDHLGIHGMRERASLLGGSLMFESKLNEGTTVLVKIPKSSL